MQSDAQGVGRIPAARTYSDHESSVRINITASVNGLPQELFDPIALNIL